MHSSHNVTIRRDTWSRTVVLGTLGGVGAFIMVYGLITLAFVYGGAQ